MQLTIDTSGTARTVVVTREDGRFIVTIDGVRHLVDARAVGTTDWSLLVGTGATDGADRADVKGGRGAATDGTATGLVPTRRVEASLVPLREAGRFDVHVNGVTVPVAVRATGLGRRGRDDGHAGGSGPQRVTAPMPGKIVRVLVAPGDEVKARQGLVVVEAMKMENELKAVRAGRVRDVHATEGQSVEAGAVLVVVE